MSRGHKGLILDKATKNLRYTQMVLRKFFVGLDASMTYVKWYHLMALLHKSLINKIKNSRKHLH
jgi:hypothetical protein